MYGLPRMVTNGIANFPIVASQWNYTDTLNIVFLPPVHPFMDVS